MTTPVPKPVIAPPGQHWERSVAADVQVLPAGGDYRKCTHYRGPTSTRRSACNAKAAAIWRGHLRCEVHLRRIGIWIDMGVAFEWALAETEEGR